MTEGNTKKILIRFAIPMILSLITQQLYNVADMVIVGQFLGVNEFAAVGNVGVIVSILVTISGGLEMGSEIIFARFLGEKKWKDIIVGTRSILLFSLFCGLGISVISILLKDQIMVWLKVPDYLIEDTGTYMTVYIAGIASIFLYDISRAILVALGNAKAPMVLVIFTSVLNILLDLVFIPVFHMGVGGAALSTILAQMVGMVISLVIVCKKLRQLTPEKIESRFDWGKLKEIFGISLPTILQQSILSLSAILLIKLVNPYGSEIISGYHAMNKIMVFGIMVVIGLSQALSVFTAANVGAGQMHRVREGYLFTMKITTIYTILVVAINFIIPKYLIGIFIDIKEYPDAYQFAKKYLQYSILAYLGWNWKIINENFIRAFMKMKAYLLSNLSDLLFKVVFTYLLVWMISLDGFWIGNTLGKVVSVGISFFVIVKDGLIRDMTKMGKKS